jgi:5-methylcytosine-specific restriction endonuclease McrA
MSAHTAVLFLDQAYRPLRIESWQRAISDFFLGKVEVVEYSADRTIQGVHATHPMPSVVRVVRHFKRDRIRLKFSRLNIYARDRFACQYCGEQKPTEALTFDHVIPRSRGGKTCWENIVTCCGGSDGCNAKKADRTPSEAGMHLLSKPRKPAYLPTITVRGMGAADIPDEWKGYWSCALEA